VADSFDDAVSVFAIAARDNGMHIDSFRMFFAQGEARLRVQDALVRRGVIERIKRNGNMIFYRWAE